MADPFWELPEDSTARRERKPRTRRRRWALGILKTFTALILLGLVSLTAVVVIGYHAVQLPNPNADFQSSTTSVLYNDGKSELGTFEVQNRQPLTFEEIPDTVKQAVVAAENRTFWTDRGISVRGILRSAWVIARGGNVQGGSTITQQYIKIMYLTREQTVTRKFKELFLAAKINRQMTKQEILTDYLNTIYFGRDAYGIQAASRAYFDVDAAKLTIPQAAVLASVLNNPSAFDPAESDDNAVALLGRYRYVLQAMSETGAISPGEASTYSQSLPKFPKIKSSQRYGGPKGFLLKMVQHELEASGLDSTRIRGGGLHIVTTFDRKSQDAAVDAAQKYTSRAAKASGHTASQLHAAVASVEVGTGDVLALYGGPDYVENSRNWATTPRPAASTFKAYVLAAGLEDGYSLKSRFNGNTFTPPDNSTPVRNEYSNQYGRVNLVRATAESINTAFVDLVTSMKDGAQKVVEMAEHAGAPKGPGWGASARNLPLGTPEVSPLAQAGAYATFGNGGTYVPTHVVREVRDADNHVIYRAKPDERRAMSSDIADDVTYALSSVVEEGTGRSVRTLNRPVAGKTGTKDVGDDITSAWFVAYTKQVSTAVMYVAGDSGGEDLDAYRRPGDRTFFGGTYPALTWEDYMETATQGMPVKDFDPPAYVNEDQADLAEPVTTVEPPVSSTAPEPSDADSSHPSSATTAPESTAPPDKSTSSAPSPSEPATNEPTAQPTDDQPTDNQPTASNKPSASSKPSSDKSSSDKSSSDKPSSDKSGATTKANATGKPASGTSPPNGER